MGIRQRKEVAGSPWVYDYKDPATGKRKLATPKSGLKKDALLLKKKIDAEIEAGVHVPLYDSPALHTVVGLYLDDNSQRVRDGRISFNYEYSMRKIAEKHLLPALGDKRMTEIKVEDVVGLYRRMIDGGCCPANARENIRRMSRIERFAARRGYTKRDVFKVATAELNGVVRQPIRTFSLDDVRKLLTAASEQRKTSTNYQTQRCQLMLQIAVNLGAFCGLRWGEIFGLTLDHVDMDTNVLKIRRSLHRISDSGRYALSTTTKTPAGQRDVPMPRHIRELLVEWFNGYVYPSPEGLIFSTDENSRSGKKGVRSGCNGGNPIMSTVFFNYWTRLLKDAGLQDGIKSTGLRFHALRHFASALMIEHHIPLTDIASLMGHKSYDITLQVYAHSIVGGAKRHDAFETMAKTVNATTLRHLPLRR